MGATIYEVTEIIGAGVRVITLSGIRSMVTTINGITEIGGAIQQISTVQQVALGTGPINAGLGPIADICINAFVGIVVGIDTSIYGVAGIVSTRIAIVADQCFPSQTCSFSAGFVPVAEVFINADVDIVVDTLTTIYRIAGVIGAGISIIAEHIIRIGDTALDGVTGINGALNKVITLEFSTRVAGSFITLFFTVTDITVRAVEIIIERIGAAINRITEIISTQIFIATVHHRILVYGTDGSIQVCIAEQCAVTNICIFQSFTIIVDSADTIRHHNFFQGKVWICADEFLADIVSAGIAVVTGTTISVAAVTTAVLV